MSNAEDAWGDVEGCLEEIEWYASRKKDLAQEANGEGSKTWADFLMQDVTDLRAALREARAADSASPEHPK